MNIGVIGLGLIGGSISKAISENTPHKVLGFDIKPQVISRAIETGTISEKEYKKMTEKITTRKARLSHSGNTP